MTRYRTCAAERQLPINLLTIPPEDLDAVLQQFYAELCKKNGDEYELESLKVMQTALERHLHEAGRCYSIQKDREFQKSRKVFNGKAIDLQQQGKGKRPMKADSLSIDDKACLWRSGVLGIDNPTILNYTRISPRVVGKSIINFE